MRVCCGPVRRQRGRREAVEVLRSRLKGPTQRALYRGRRNSGKDIDAAPAINVVGRACRAALGGRNKVRCVV